jgi:hypothetical protein
MFMFALLISHQEFGRNWQKTEIFSCQGQLWQRWRALAKLRRHLEAAFLHDFSSMAEEDST